MFARFWPYMYSLLPKITFIFRHHTHSDLAVRGAFVLDVCIISSGVSGPYFPKIDGELSGCTSDFVGLSAETSIRQMMEEQEGK